MDPAQNIAESLKLQEQTRAARIDFLKAEVEISLTFARSALDAGDDVEKRERNLENARKGYASFVHFSREEGFERVSPEVRQSLEERFAELRDALLQLGEKL